jgi:hypothetical protein
MCVCACCKGQQPALAAGAQKLGCVCGITIVVHSVVMKRQEVREMAVLFVLACSAGCCSSQGCMVSPLEAAGWGHHQLCTPAGRQAAVLGAAAMCQSPRAGCLGNACCAVRRGGCRSQHAGFSSWLHHLQEACTCVHAHWRWLAGGWP